MGQATLCDRLSRLRDCKSQRCEERSEGGAEGGAHRKKKKKPLSYVGWAQDKGFIWKGGLGGIPLQYLQIHHLAST